jgi:hypothetical protein
MDASGAVCKSGRLNIYIKMELIISILLFLHSSGSFGHEPKTTTMRISVTDCRAEKGDSWYRGDSISIYKLPENKLVYKFKPGMSDNQPVTIQNLDTGNYHLVFKNSYYQTITQPITLEDKRLNEITLCMDKLSSYPQNTLVKLQDKDTISISFFSMGCFHMNVMKVLITKEADRFIAQLYKVSTFVPETRKRSQQLVFGQVPVKTVYMTQQHIDDFNRFENELKYATDQGCTTTDTYEIKSRDLNMKRTDGSCSWRGFHYFAKSVFGDIKY